MSAQHSDGYSAAIARFERALDEVVDRLAAVSHQQVRETLDELRESTLELMRASRRQSEDDLTVLFDDLVVRYGLRLSKPTTTTAAPSDEGAWDDYDGGVGRP